MSATYTPLCIVQVRLSGGVSGGSAGPNTSLRNPDGTYTLCPSAPDFVYDVTDLFGVVLGTNMTPTKPRRAPLSPGQGLGTGYLDATGTFQLYDANEMPRVPGPGGL